jgi:hypothetical protein
MNKEQIEDYVIRYLDATHCQIIEKSPAHVTVKLSPEADKALTNRSYYWNFVERTGADPETMTFTFVFDMDQMELMDERKKNNAENKSTAPAGPASNSNAPNDSILGLYFGFVPTAAQGRSHRDHLTYGSSRLQQIFQTVKSQGRFIHLYEEPMEPARFSLQTSAYSSWFAVNYKVEFTCDMKREELHSLGISLSTGEIVEEFHPYLLTKVLTPRLPVNTHIRETISLQRAQHELNKYLEQIIQPYNHDWAVEARERMKVEISRMESYYHDLMAADVDEAKKTELKEQYQNRLEEIQWQYEPRIQVTVINCGIFHLLSDHFNKTR